MIRLAILLVMLASSFTSSSMLEGLGTYKTMMNTGEFCSPLGEDCVGKKCLYYEKCPASSHPYKCGEDKCIRDKSLCESYLYADSYFKSRYFKHTKITTLLEQVVKEMTKQETQFKAFQSKIRNCSRPTYFWKQSDVCLLSMSFKLQVIPCKDLGFV